ncbi:MAG: cytochrome c biogenesis protein ResB, partial [Rhodoferax sp.]|nr:cytochrome c biogenesis protein ResB [Actinomycetota bacterium]
MVTDTSTEPHLPQLGPIGTVGFVWRQLTSMRTALFLLMLLGVAAGAGAGLPQRGVNPGQVSAYFQTHAGTAPWIDRLGGIGG